MPRRVTPDGVRAGVPEALAGLVELRGSAVRAYAGAVAAREGALAAAEEAMAGFRSHVVQAADVRELNPDSILLRAVRRSSAARARRPTESGGTLRRIAGRADSACELVPRLLAARANRELSHDDAARLDRHLASCPQCRELRQCFRTAEHLYAEAAGTPLAERDARALLVALAGAGPLADGTPQSIAEEALALLPAEALSRPGQARVAAPPTEPPAPRTALDATPPEAMPPPDAMPPSSPADATSPPTRPPDPWPTDPRPTDPRPTDPWPTDPGSADAQPAPPTRPADPWPTDPWPTSSAAADARPAPNTAPPEGSAARDGGHVPRANGVGASARPPAAQHGARVGTTPGRVSFARRTVIVRSGIEQSGPAAPALERKPEPPTPEPEPPAALAAAPEPEPAALEPEPEPEPAALEPEPEPAAPAAPPDPEPTSNGARHGTPVPAPPPVVTTHVPAPTADGPGAPPDSGTLARIIPGLLIVMAIGIALLVAGIVGADNTPATTNDVAPPSLREPVRELDPRGTLRTPPAPESDAAADAN